MITKLTSEDINLLWDANQEVIGTSDYSKYWMETYSKYAIDNNKWSNWIFTGWGIVTTHTAEVKKYGNNVYIISRDLTGPVRWKVTDAVNELLKIY